MHCLLNPAPYVITGRNNFIVVCILAASSILLHFINKQPAYPFCTMGGGPNTGFRTVAYYVNWCVGERTHMQKANVHC